MSVLAEQPAALALEPRMRPESNLWRDAARRFRKNKLAVGALVVMVIPVIVLFLSQRFFMQDMIITQIEK